jgi:hypothetical protein
VLGDNPGVSVRGPQAVEDGQVLQGSDPEPFAPDEQRVVGAQSRRPLVAGAVAGLWALMVGLALITCVVMLVWAISPNSAGDAAAAWQAAGLTWLAAHLVPLVVAGEPLTLLPIGGLLLGLLLARRSGSWTGRLLTEPSAREVAWVVVGASMLYGFGGAAVAWLSAGEPASAEPGVAGAVTGAVAAVGVLWGIAGEAGLVDRARGRISDAAWRTAVAGLAAVVGLFAAGAVLVTVSLVRHFADVATTLADLDPGIVGAAGVTLVDALSLPNLAVWAVAVIVGPGFHLGSTGGLSAFGGEVESLPALPVLAAIPTSMPAWAPVLMVVPVLLGVLAGRIRWGRDLPTLSGTVLGALGLAAVVAPLVAGMLRLSTGALGAERLAEVGPDLLPVTAAATGLVLLGFLGEAGFQSLRLSWDLHRAERRAAGLRTSGPGAAEGAAEPVGVAAEGRDPAGAEPDGFVSDAESSDGPGGAGGWAQGASRSVSRRVTGAGASAVSVVTGVGGAALAAAAGVGAAIAGTRGNSPAGSVALAEVAQADAEQDGATRAPADTTEPGAAPLAPADVSIVPDGPGHDAEQADVVDVRDDEIDLRVGTADPVVVDEATAPPPGASVDDEPVEVVAVPSEAAAGDDSSAGQGDGPLVRDGDGDGVRDGEGGSRGPDEPQSDRPTGSRTVDPRAGATGDLAAAWDDVPDTPDPDAPAALGTPAPADPAPRVSPGADDDTAEIPVIGSAGALAGEAQAGRG